MDLVRGNGTPPGVLIDQAIAEDLSQIGDITSAATIPSHARGAARVVARAPGVLAGLAVVDRLVAEFELADYWEPLLSRRRPARTREPDRPDRRADAFVAGDRADSAQLPPAVERDRNADGPVCRRGRRHASRRFTTRARPPRAGVPWKSTPSGVVEGLTTASVYMMPCSSRTIISPGSKRPALWASPIRSRRRSRPRGRIRPSVQRSRSRLIHSNNSTGRSMRGPDIILVDNLAPELVAEAVRRRDQVAPRVKLEASGGVNLATVRALAQTGVDRISVGALDSLGAGLGSRARLRSGSRVLHQADERGESRPRH